jgi:hypothetical protein
MVAMMMALRRKPHMETKKRDFLFKERLNCSKYVECW